MRLSTLKVFAILICVSGAPAAEERKDSGKPAIRFEMNKRPSLQAGDWLKVDFRAKVQMDLHDFSDSADEESLFEAKRMRVGVEGRILDDLAFEIEYELLPGDHQLRDAFVNYRRYRGLRVQAGKFKIPFGMDQLTSPTKLDFIYRSRIGSQLAPGRDNGVMLHGSMFESGFHYQAGVFQHDGEIAEAKGGAPTGSRTVAGRVNVAPFQWIPSPSFLRKFEAGAAMTHSDVAEGMNGLRGRTVAGDTYFDRMFVKGARTRRGLEANWLIGSLALNGEFMSVRQQREGQSLRGTDLPDLLASGWYASATHPLVRTIEAAVRYEQIRFGSVNPGSAAASRSTRAANVLGNSDRALTLGLNWQATRYTRFQFNAVRETLEDAARFPVSGIRRYWTFAGRMQFTM